MRGGQDARNPRVAAAGAFGVGHCPDRPKSDERVGLPSPVTLQVHWPVASASQAAAPFARAEGTARAQAVPDCWVASRLWMGCCGKPAGHLSHTYGQCCCSRDMLLTCQMQSRVEEMRPTQLQHHNLGPNHLLQSTIGPLTTRQCNCWRARAAHTRCYLWGCSMHEHHTSIHSSTVLTGRLAALGLGWERFGPGTAGRVVCKRRGSKVCRECLYRLHRSCAAAAAEARRSEQCAKESHAFDCSLAAAMLGLL
jgi:hypothetical protein